MQRCLTKFGALLAITLNQEQPEIKAHDKPMMNITDSVLPIALLLFLVGLLRKYFGGYLSKTMTNPILL